MHTPTKTILVGLLSITLIAPGFAQSLSERRQTDCIARINDRTAALVAQDWQELERRAEEYSKQCKGAFSADDDSMALENIALANFKQGKSKKAIVAADACLRLSFSNSGCHIWRIQALFASGNVSDARSSLERFDRLLAHLIERNDKELTAARSALDREFYESIRNKYQAQSEQAAALRERYIRP